MRVLSRAWQMLLKGMSEVQAADRPLAAAEMLLVRIAYVADLPTPDEVIRSLDDGGGSSGAASRRGNGNGGVRHKRQLGTSVRGGAAPRLADVPASRLAMTRRAAAVRAPWRFSPRPRSSRRRLRRARRRLRSTISPSWSRLASDKRDIQTKLALERDVRLVRCEDGKLEIALEPSAAKTLVNDLSRKLQLWTGRSWMVVISREPGAADAEIGGRRAQGRARGRRARRSAGQGGAGTISRCGDCRRARRPRTLLPEPPATAEPEIPLPDDIGFGDNWERDE